MGWEAIAGPVLGAITGGAIGMTGQEQSNATNVRLAHETMDFNKRMADRQMHFQKYMSNTAHFREIKDLKRAGLNPILSAMGGGGASSPSGASASASPASVENTMGGLGEAAADILPKYLATQAQSNANKRNEKELDLLAAQTEATHAQAKKTLTEEEVARKGVPAAEGINMLWDKFKSGLKNLEGATESGAKSIMEKMYSPEKAVERKQKTPYRGIYQKRKD